MRQSTHRSFAWFRLLGVAGLFTLALQVQAQRPVIPGAGGRPAGGSSFQPPRPGAPPRPMAQPRQPLHTAPPRHANPPVHAAAPKHAPAQARVPQGGHLPPPSPRPAVTQAATAVAVKSSIPQRHYPPSPSSFSVQNPFVSASRLVQYGAPLPVGRVDFPVTAVGPVWQEAQQLIHNGNSDGAQHLISMQLQQDPSLAGLLAAVSAGEQANLSEPALQALRGQAQELAQSQIAAGTQEPLPFVAVARFALEDQQDEPFRKATQTLVERFPENQYTSFFQGVRQLKDKDWQGAQQSLQRARALGVPAPSLADLLKVAIDGQDWVWEYAELTLYVLGGWLAGLVLLFVLGKLFSARTLKALQRSGPDLASTGERWLRRGYRWIINLAGVYYYLSLPVLVLLALALPLSVGYGLLMVPWLNMGLVVLVLVLGAGGVLTALSGVRAAFVRVRDQDFGRPVSPKEWPALWQVVREVAERVGTRCVDEIWVLASPELAVMERGGLWRRLRNRGRRVLILGLGSLQGLKLDAFKAILAHEYGHFQNRDTAGGDVALRVNRAMRNFADAVSRSGKVRWWNVSVHFLRVYHYLFRRLTFGASRLQEVLADRVAVLRYGRSAFVEGLSHAIRRSVEFQNEFGRAVRDAMRGGLPALALHQPAAPPELSERESMESAVRKILERPTDADDSHPSPKDRFALAAHVGAEDPPVAPEAVWDLLPAKDPILGEMQSIVAKVVGMEAGRVKALQGALLDKLSWMLRFSSAPQAYFERARIYLHRGDYQKAVEDLNRVLLEAPHLGEVRFRRALAYQQLGRYDLAVDDLRRVLQQPTDKPLSADDRCCLYATLGDCQAQAGRLPEAVDAYSEALASHQTSLVSLTGRGRVYRVQGEYERALQDLSAAIEHWPNSPEPYLERANVHEATGNGEEAGRDRATAQQLTPGLKNGVVQVTNAPLVAVTW